MKAIQADVLFPVSIPPIRDGILLVDDEGVVMDVIDPDHFSGSLPEQIEKAEGFICPGFVNTHCHLELSHLKGRFEERTGLVGFIDQMRLGRHGENIIESINDADQEMHENGIVAVADICNTDHTLNAKKKSNIFYHSFIEIFDIIPGRAEKVFADGIQLKNKFSESNLSCSLAPHAPYTASSALLSLLTNEYKHSPAISTIHNQETEDEDSMFHSQTGDLFDFLFSLNPAIKESKNDFDSSLEYILNNLSGYKKLLLVHNTFTKKVNLEKAFSLAENLYWALCPNANLYIENKLPDINLLRENGCKLTIGTDSYASNKSLSVLDELKTISFAYPDISLDELFVWACKNGADFIEKSAIFGSFEKGKRPGLVQILNVDNAMLKLTEQSIAKMYNH